MKKTIVVLSLAVALVGCQQKVNEPSGSQKESIKEAEKAQKQSLREQKKEVEKTASAEKKEISEAAGAQKEKVEAQAEASKADINAQEKKVEAQAKAEKAEAEAQSKEAKAQSQINESAGATSGLGPKDQASSDSDRQIVKQVRQSTSSAAQPISETTFAIMSNNGEVTLIGFVASEAEKSDVEAKAKAVSGVKSVNNQLKVKQ